MAREDEVLTWTVPGVVRTGVTSGQASVVASTARPAASTQYLLAQITQLPVVLVALVIFLPKCARMIYSLKHCQERGLKMLAYMSMLCSYFRERLKVIILS